MEYTPKQIIRELMVGVVPERQSEIDQLWKTYNPDVVIIEDKPGIILDANRDRIRFSPKTMDVFWLIGFSGWRAIECYSPHVICSAYGTSLQSLIDSDENLPEIEIQYKERLATAKSLIASSDTASADWPPDIPLPSANREVFDNVQYRVAFDLSLIAAGFTFLHEFRHVMLDVEKKRPIDRKEEELQADVWARDFITAKLESYAKDNSHDYHQVLRKRSMGLAIAALILHEITPQYGGNCSYFSIKIRLSTLLDNTPLPEDDNFWRFSASLLIGIFRQRHIPLPAEPMSPRALAACLLDLMPE